MSEQNGSDKRVFSTRKSMEVEIDGEDYVLSGCSGKDRSAHLNLLTSRSDNNGRIRNFSGIHEDLISRCLTNKSTNEKVPIKELSEWGGDVLEALYDVCSEMSGLKEDSEKKYENTWT